MKLIKIIILLFVVLPSFAQEGEQEPIVRDPKAQERIKAAHAAYLTERLDLTSEEAEKFWPVYREYTSKRKDLRQRFKDAKSSGANEKKLLDLDLEIKQQELDLEKEYTEKLQQIISPQKLISLRQSEADFRKLVLRQIYQRRENIERRQKLRDRMQERRQQN
jgi:hypothetical protein